MCTVAGDERQQIAERYPEVRSAALSLADGYPGKVNSDTVRSGAEACMHAMRDHAI
jgi:hypothetical protein